LVAYILGRVTVFGRAYHVGYVTTT